MTVLAASEVGSTLVLRSADLPALIAALGEDGRTVIGPTIRDGAIVCDVVADVADLPAGWTSIQEAGRYRLERRSDAAVFGHAVGPHAWRRFLDPPRQTLIRASRDAAGTTRLASSEAPVPRYAFLGVRPCDLAALAIQDRVHRKGPWPDEGYAARREAALIVAVQCTEPAATCFCASLGTGPGVSGGHDLALTEILEDGRHVFLIEVGSERGSRVVSALPTSRATGPDAAAAATRLERARGAMGRTLDVRGLRERLGRSWDDPCWEAIGARCLGCANCTLVCPTCFCATLADRASLDGRGIERERRWDSCFTLGFTHIHGGSQRASIASRYRQWMTHKLSTWHDQFGTSGCVGCGRCITWCPAAIDITEEAKAFAAAEE